MLDNCHPDALAGIEKNKFEPAEIPGKIKEQLSG